MKKIAIIFGIIFLGGIFLTFTACSKKEEPRQGVLFSGTVETAPQVKGKIDPLSVLFIIARSPGGQIQAVKKILPPFEFPLSFAMTAEDQMIPGMKLSQDFKISARLDKDGNANPTGPGDILGTTETPTVRAGSIGIKITLSEIVE